jgi:UDP-N-acetylglucosamine 3-dehydrogenase
VRVVRKLKVGVIGCGSWGLNHARVYTELPSVELVRVVDLDRGRAEKTGLRYDVDWDTDIYRILEDSEIEAVSICTPTITHADIALLSLEHDKNILVEKPMTNTLEEAEEVIRKSEKAGLKLSVGFVERFNPAVMEASRLIDEGVIGEVILAHTRRVSRRPLRIGDVGVVKDLAIHDVDIINQIFKEEPKQIFGIAGSIAHKFEDYANINLSYHGNRNAFIETNWLTPKVVRTLTITGSEGIINIHYRSQEITIENNERLLQPYLEYREPLYLELEDFASSILEDREPCITGEDGYKALKICEGALISAKKGEAVDLDSMN